MGLIRKQLNAGLDENIEKWIHETLGPYFQYTIDDNCQEKMESEYDYWSTITYLIQREIEIPDYISFTFEGRIMHITSWELDVESVINILNKHFQAFSNLDLLRINNHRTCRPLEYIKIVRTSDRYLLR